MLHDNNPLSLHRLNLWISFGIQEISKAMQEQHTASQHVLNSLKKMTQAGGDRQELHEKIRVLSQQAGANVKEKGLDNNLLELIAADERFGMTLEQLQSTMEPGKYTGCAAYQVDNFLNTVVRPMLDANQQPRSKCFSYP